MGQEGLVPGGWGREDGFRPFPSSSLQGELYFKSFSAAHSPPELALCWNGLILKRDK